VSGLRRTVRRAGLQPVSATWRRTLPEGVTVTVDGVMTDMVADGDVTDGRDVGRVVVGLGHARRLGSAAVRRAGAVGRAIRGGAGDRLPVPGYAGFGPP
jgi:hypothetical protein